MITYKKGDCLELSITGMKDDEFVLIPHICNDIGGYGSGFVAAINKKWDTPRKNYLNWYTNKDNLAYGENTIFKLGNIQSVKVQERVYVINMIAQSGTISPENPKPIKYVSLIKCLEKIRLAIKINNQNYKCTIHAPKFGSGLAGGNWQTIEDLINEIWADLNVTIYEFP